MKICPFCVAAGGPPKNIFSGAYRRYYLSTPPDAAYGTFQKIYFSSLGFQASLVYNLSDTPPTLPTITNRLVRYKSSLLQINFRRLWSQIHRDSVLYVIVYYS